MQRKVCVTPLPSVQSIWPEFWLPLLNSAHSNIECHKRRSFSALNPNRISLFVPFTICSNLLKFRVPALVLCFVIYLEPRFPMILSVNTWTCAWRSCAWIHTIISPTYSVLELLAMLCSRAARKLKFKFWDAGRPTRPFGSTCKCQAYAPSSVISWVSLSFLG